MILFFFPRNALLPGYAFEAMIGFYLCITNSKALYVFQMSSSVTLWLTEPERRFTSRLYLLSRDILRKIS
jgi:hypothetical protein